MKTKLFVLVATFILAFAGTVLAQQNNKDFAHGNGSVEFEGKVSNFSFSAQRQRDGSVKGNLVIHQRSETNPENNISAHMRIDCLTIVGNTATIQGIITQADPEFIILPDNTRFDLIGAAASMTVYDGGNGNNAQDLASQFFITGGRSNFCQIQFPADMYRTTNVTVRGGN